MKKNAKITQESGSGTKIPIHRYSLKLSQKLFLSVKYFARISFSMKESPIRPFLREKYKNKITSI